MRRFRRRRDRTENVYEANVPIFALIGALLLYFLRFGYDYANSDQDEIIPYLLHHLDPGLFTQDWFVSTQLSDFSVRTYFVWLLNSFSLILPVWLTTLVLYVVVWMFIAGAVYKLAFFFTGDQLAGVASVFLALVFTPIWTLGGNDLVHSMLVASMVAWALSLWAIYHYLRSRFLLAPVLLGVACWMQALVGLHIAFLLVTLRTIRWIRGEPGPHNLGGILMFGALFLLWSSPSLGPIVYQQILARPEPIMDGPSLFYILAEFRLPHHYLPGSFYTGSYVRFGALAVLALSSLLSVRHRRGIQRLDFILRTLLLIALLCVISAVFTEFVPVLMVAKLQLFKMTVLAKLFFVILICGAVTFWLPDAIRHPMRSILLKPQWSLSVMVLIAIGVVTAVVKTDGFLHERVGPFRRGEEPIGQVQSWVKRNTPTASIFAVPPSYSSFRSETHRTIVINYKAIPFEDEQMLVWFDRLLDMAPIELPERGGQETMAQLDSAYARLSAAELGRLAEQYRFEFVVRPAPLEGAVRLEGPSGRQADDIVADADGSAPGPGDDAASGGAESDAATAGQEGDAADADGASVQSDEESGASALLQDDADAPADTAAAPGAGRSVFSEVFRAGDLYVYRLIAPADEETETPE